MKKGNHPPFKVIVSHNDKGGAFSPEISRSMFDVVCSAPHVQGVLVFLESLHMQDVSFDVSIDIFIINICHPYSSLIV